MNNLVIVSLYCRQKNPYFRALPSLLPYIKRRSCGHFQLGRGLASCTYVRIWHKYGINHVCNLKPGTDRTVSEGRLDNLLQG